MAKKKNESKKLGIAQSLDVRLDAVTHSLEAMDWSGVQGASALASEEVDALSTGAMAAINMMRAMIGGLGPDSKRHAIALGPVSLAEGIMWVAIDAYRRTVVDAEDVGVRAEKPGVRITIEHKG